MTKRQMQAQYFDWMLDLVRCDEVFDIFQYTELLNHLFDIPFKYLIAFDANRYQDGVDLRKRFCTEYNINDMESGCSVLEMMVALAVRCEEQIMSDPEYGNRTGLWFWEMICSLGLEDQINGYISIDKVNQIMIRFLNREYAPNGAGGLYTVYSRDDIRNVEIWYQMMIHLNEIC